ncbi:MAG: hypothetical protein E2O79_11155 [Caldithrix sp.]|nr:MAG: hypothetical protein E2O79_11155 [Caldithrix sp.]
MKRICLKIHWPMAVSNGSMIIRFKFPPYLGLLQEMRKRNKKQMGYIYDVKLQRKLYAQGDKVKYPE